MSTRPLKAITYHPLLRWGCRFCEHKGEVSCPPREYGDVSYQRVLDAHEELSPWCAKRNRDRGIAVRFESGSLPE